MHISSCIYPITSCPYSFFAPCTGRQFFCTYPAVAFQYVPNSACFLTTYILPPPLRASSILSGSLLVQSFTQQHHVSQRLKQTVFTSFFLSTTDLRRHLFQSRPHTHTTSQRLHHFPFLLPVRENLVRWFVSQLNLDDHVQRFLFTLKICQKCFAVRAIANGDVSTNMNQLSSSTHIFLHFWQLPSHSRTFPPA